MKRKELAVVVLSGLLALTFFAAGVMKLASIAPAPENFARWGFPVAFRYVVGVVEVRGAIGLFVPRAAAIAAIVLIGDMLGAIGTGIMFHESAHVIGPLILSVLLAFVAYARREPVLRVLRARARQ